MGRALVVEDNALVCAMLSDMVQEMGFDVTATRRVTDAHEAVSDHAYDLVVTDLGLDGDSRAGLMIVDALVQKRRDTRIVVMSGHPKPDELHSDIAFLQKPVTLAQLQRAIGGIDATNQV